MITKELLQEDIKEFADQFILDLAIPSVVGLKGTLGAGKTTLIKSFMHSLGVKENIHLQPLILLKLIE